MYLRVDTSSGRRYTEPSLMQGLTMDTTPALEAMLAAFDPERHGGEAMAFAPVGNEVLCDAPVFPNAVPGISQP